MLQKSQTVGTQEDSGVLVA